MSYSSKTVKRLVSTSTSVTRLVRLARRITPPRLRTAASACTSWPIPILSTLFTPPRSSTNRMCPASIAFLTESASGDSHAVFSVRSPLLNNRTKSPSVRCWTWRSMRSSVAAMPRIGKRGRRAHLTSFEPFHILVQLERRSRPHVDILRDRPVPLEIQRHGMAAWDHAQVSGVADQTRIVSVNEDLGLFRLDLYADIAGGTAAGVRVPPRRVVRRPERI